MEDNDPLDTMLNLLGQVRQYNEAIADDFSHWQAKGHEDVESYMVDVYVRSIASLNTAYQELTRPANNQDEIQIIINNLINILERMCAFFQRPNYDFSRATMRSRLQDALSHFSYAIYIPHTQDDITRHRARMYEFIHSRLQPSARSLWVNDDLPANEDFNNAYQGFRQLRNLLVESDTDRADIIIRSNNFVNEARRSLGLRDGKIPGPNFFGDARRPTYIDFPHTSPEAQAGYNGRPGIMALRQRIGDRLTAEEQRQEAAARVERQPATPVNQPVPAAQLQQPPPALVAQLPLPAARVVPQVPPPVPPLALPALQYNLSFRQARRDIRDCLQSGEAKPSAIGKFEQRRNAYPQGANPNLIPTTLRNETVSSWRSDINALYSEVNNIWDHNNPPQDPDIQANRVRDLRRALTGARHNVRQRLSNSKSTNNKQMKDARLKAMRMRYLRAVLMFVLLSPDGPNPLPNPSAALNRELEARYQESALYERIWNMAENEDVYRRKRGANDETKAWIKAAEANRAKTIRRFSSRARKLRSDQANLDQLEAGHAQQVAGREAAVKAAQQAAHDHGLLEQLQASEAARLAAEETVRSLREELERLRNRINNPDNGPRLNSNPKNNTNAAGPSEEAQRGALNLNYILGSTQPANTVFEGAYDQRMRVELREAYERAGLEGTQYMPPVDPNNPPTNGFTATCGPPGIEGMQRNTTAQRLVYMIVMLHWRFYQATNLRLH
ncbi:hypothetical protein F5Y15DRAFT_292806 [Xylariaceae sp. FL0016]|nr:hypothetical protein F5Y15DRAFT_292806 [Xylariaceae sp. FL0016]